MAIITAVKAGNWSDPTVWSGGVKPSLGDSAQCNGKVVTIDENVDLGTGELILAAGGHFQVDAGGITITCLRVGGGAGNDQTLYYHHAAPGECVLNANVYGGTQSGTPGVWMDSTGKLTINGDCDTGVNGSSYSVRLQYCHGTLVVNGTVKATGGSGRSLLNYLGNADITINGDCIAGESGGANAVVVYGAGSRLTINGNIYGGNATATSNTAVVVQSSYMRVTGNVYGRGTGHALEVQVYTAGGSWRITGNVYGNNWVPGGAIARPYYGVFNSGGAPLVVTGQLVDGLGGVPAVAGVVLRDVATPQPYVDLAYIDPATEVVTMHRLREAMVQAQVSATVSPRVEITATVKEMV